MAWRTQRGSHSVAEEGTGLVGKVGPWLQGEPGPLGCPERSQAESDRLINRPSNLSRLKGAGKYNMVKRNILSYLNPLQDTIHPSLLTCSVLR